MFKKKDNFDIPKHLRRSNKNIKKQKKENVFASIAEKTDQNRRIRLAVRHQLEIAKNNQMSVAA